MIKEITQKGEEANVAFKTFEAIREQMKLDARSSKIKDEVYHKNVVERSLMDLIGQYLTGGNSLIFEVRPADLDPLIDIIENSKLSNDIEFKQLQPYLFEIRYKTLNVFK